MSLDKSNQTYKKTSFLTGIKIEINLYKFKLVACLEIILWQNLN